MLHLRLKPLSVVIAGNTTHNKDNIISMFQAWKSWFDFKIRLSLKFPSVMWSLFVVWFPLQALVRHRLLWQHNAKVQSIQAWDQSLGEFQSSFVAERSLLKTERLTSKPPSSLTHTPNNTLQASSARSDLWAVQDSKPRRRRTKKEISKEALVHHSAILGSCLGRKPQSCFGRKKELRGS